MIEMHENAVKIGEGKIQELGTAFYIHLPVLWRKKMALKKGDTLEIYSDGGAELMIKAASDGGGSD